MLTWKAFGILLLTSSLIIGGLQYSLVSAELIIATHKTTIAVQQTEIVQYKNNNYKLEQAVATEKDTIKTLLGINEKSGERLYELTGKNQQIFAQNARINQEINDLRETEATLALEKPYSRGLAAGDRFNSIMLLISGETSSTGSGDLHNTSTTKN